MLKDLQLFAGLVFLGAAVICVTVWRLDRWLSQADRPKIKRPLRVHKSKKPKYEPPMPKQCKVVPSTKYAIEEETL